MTAILQTFQKGGFIMYPIVLLAIAGLYLVIEKWFLLQKSQIRNENEINGILSDVKNNKLGEANKKCIAGETSIHKVISAGIDFYDRNETVIEKVMDDVIISEISKIERFLPAIATIASVLPMLGLLGTVSGMISLFNSLSVHGTNNASYFAGGISEALITTQAGLVFAIPILFCYTLLSAKVNYVISQMESSSRKLINCKITGKGIEG